MKCQSARYTVHHNILYQRLFTKPLLWCIPPSQVNSLLAEMQERICGGHLGPRTLVERVINPGYNWPTLREDARQYVKSCNTCQIFGCIPQLPSIEQTLVVAAWPFDMWSMDLMGKFPKARNGYEFLVLAVDYFSKWIEARALTHRTEESVIKFFHESILCRFGVPRAVVTNHGNGEA